MTAAAGNKGVPRLTFKSDSAGSGDVLAVVIWNKRQYDLHTDLARYVETVLDEVPAYARLVLEGAIHLGV